MPFAMIARRIACSNVIKSIPSSSFRGVASSGFSPIDKIDASQTIYNLVPEELRKEPPARDTLLFGRTFSDHMVTIDWEEGEGWGAPVISEFKDLSISPAGLVLHYGIECFEGMKAYKDNNGQIRLFRPELNMNRMNKSMKRISLPKLDEDGFLEVIKQLVRVDESWIPTKHGYSLYIRPTAIGTSPYLGVQSASHCRLFVILSPVGPYYKSGFVPIKLLADTNNVRAWPGGVGNVKVGGNYGPTIAPSKKALVHHGCSQIMWLFGEDHEITEVGAMNIFFILKKKCGKGVEIVTAPLTRGDILPGVTRDSVLSILRSPSYQSPYLKKYGPEVTVSERFLTMAEVVAASKEERLLEVFGCGTAVIISPVCGIVYKDDEITIPSGTEDAGPIARECWEQIMAIQYGEVPCHWSTVI